MILIPLSRRSNTQGAKEMKQESDILRGVEGGATLAFPAFRFIIGVKNPHMAMAMAGSSSSSSRNLSGFTWHTPSITFVITSWWL